ncbi:MAG: TetR/AcrR family transcriptional regulator [Halioglobus sp.]
MSVDNHDFSEGNFISNKKAAIRRVHSAAIISAAEKVFALKGFNGATTQEIADLAGLPKANVHYYFKTKKDLYNTVLEDVVVVWKTDADAFNKSEDPTIAISEYIRSKMDYSFSRPFGSKVWANEIIHGAPVMGDKRLARFLNIWEKRKTIQISRWVKQGKILPVDPHYLLFMIWATTQHYADFEHQIRVLNGNKSLSKKQQEAAIETVTGIILRGIGLNPAA